MRFRVLNAVASAVLIGYNLAIQVWPMVGLNVVLVGINVWVIWGLLRKRHDARAYDVVALGVKEPFLAHLLQRHAEDISRFNPSPERLLAEAEHAFLVSSGDELVGVPPGRAVRADGRPAGGRLAGDGGVGAVPGSGRLLTRRRAPGAGPGRRSGVMEAAGPSGPAAGATSAVPPLLEATDLAAVREAVAAEGRGMDLAGARLHDEGYENLVLRTVDGWILRFPHRAEPDFVREVAVLRLLVGRLPVPVPEVAWTGSHRRPG